MSAPAPHTDDVETAFADLLERARPRLIAFARRLCSAGGDADDVVQAALERAWRYRHGWDARGNGEAWLLRTVFRVVIDQRRAHQRRPRLAGDMIADAAHTAACPVELRDEIEHALRRLNRIERAVLLGFHRDGLGIEELARRHALPANTIKSHLHRARRKLPGGHDT